MSIDLAAPRLSRDLRAGGTRGIETALWVLVSEINPPTGAHT
ncbi:hypothetical protein [Microbacterium sp. NPDC087868]